MRAIDWGLSDGIETALEIMLSIGLTVMVFTWGELAALLEDALAFIAASVVLDGGVMGAVITPVPMIVTIMLVITVVMILLVLMDVIALVISVFIFISSVLMLILDLVDSHVL